MNASLDSTGQLASSPSGRRVAIITGGSQGIGTGLVSGFRREGYAVVATSRFIGGADEDNYLTVRGDIAEAQTARNVVEQALNRFARIDCLVNDAGDRLDLVGRRTLWHAFERFLVRRYPGAMSIYADDAEPGDNQDDNRAFLRSLGYRPVAGTQPVFTKDVAR